MAKTVKPPETVREAVELAAGALSRRPMSRAGLIDKLSDKGCAPELSEKAALRMEELGYLDDATFAGSLARHYTERGYGEFRIRAEMRRKKIPEDVIDEALREFENPDKIDEVIRAKLRGREASPDERRKISMMLARRGFSWDDINSATRRYFDNDVEDSDVR